MNFTEIAVGVVVTAVGVALGLYAKEKFLK
jgi:hypothetical protein